MNKFKWQNSVGLITVVIVLMTVALQKNGTLFGAKADEMFRSSQVQPLDTNEPLQTLADGTIVVNTTTLTPKVIGFGGPTPINIFIKNGIVDDIKPLSNSETPDFFNNASSGILPKYKNLSVGDAMAAQVDVVSGATYSSTALIENVRRGLQYALPLLPEQPAVVETPVPTAAPISWPKVIVSIIVIIGGAVLPLWLKGKGFRLLQLLLNVAVLGCWCGTFISYSLLVNYLSNGVANWFNAIAALLLIAVALLFPLFGRSRHYCLWLCPLGSAQELLGKIVKKKPTLSRKTLKTLSIVRWSLWSLLMLLMMTGLWFEWMDYELFSIFLFNQASWLVIVLSLLFAALSLFVQRPYCRFLCPTGCLLQTLENKKLESQM